MGFVDLMKNHGISASAAKQLRAGIATGEIIFNLYVKGDCDSVRRAVVEASKAPKLTYEATLQTLTKRLHPRS